jgi:hypothetical protein
MDEGSSHAERRGEGKRREKKRGLRSCAEERGGRGGGGEIL